MKGLRFSLGPFEKHPANPILTPRGDTWEAKEVFNPAAVEKDGKVFLLYRAEDRTGEGAWNGTSRIGLATSDDGVNFERRPEPVLALSEPHELSGGCEDPRVVRVDGTYYMTYTGFDGETARLCLATSTDLVEWEKHGILFPEWTGDTGKIWSKSGAMLPEPVGGRYVMYFGDTSIWAAYSEDLISWTPVEEPVLEPSTDPDAFDSALVEPGPPPILTDEGIILIYNAARCVNERDDPSYGKLRYSAGQVLLDREGPGRALRRMEEPFIIPEGMDETSGQVNDVVFVEGLVKHREAFYLYYGMADSRIGVAVLREG